MPANLSPEYKKAEERFRHAKSVGEKLVCLEEMLSTIPKHKGTEKMQADLKSRIAKLRKGSGDKKGAKRADWFHVEKQGAGQVAVFGAPNAGKSALVNALTGLPTTVAPYPFATAAPAAGMMPFEEIQIQLVDTPPLVPDSPAWVYHILRTADLAVWLVDLSDDALLDEVDETKNLLAGARITLAPSEELHFLKTMICGSKCDDPAAGDRLAILKEMLGDEEILPVSVVSGAGLEELKRRLFLALDKIRVYTKKPGKPADFSDPVIVKSGATVMDVAFHLHKDIAAGLSFARLWHKSEGQDVHQPAQASGLDGRRVERGHICQDQDILEFHT